MKSLSLPLVLFALLAVVFLVDLNHAAARLPARVATHFDEAGRANGWMTRPGDIAFVACLGFGLAFTMIGLMFSIRFMPASLINLPHREYWLAPERRPETDAFLLRHSFWFASLALCFADRLHQEIVAANRVAPPQLDTRGALTIAGGFIAGVAIWSTVMIVRFARKR